MHQISAEDSFSTREGDVKATLAVGVMDNPLSNTGIALGSLKNVLRLSQRFQVYRRLIGIKSKTLIRILITKWWYEGLEFYERDLLEILVKSAKGVLPEHFILRGLESSMLKSQVETHYHFEKDHEWFFPQLFKLIYKQHDYRAVCGLSRIRKFFDIAFIRKGPEQSGKPRLKRARIRGYRDGKGKPMDQSLKDVAAANLFYYNLIDTLLNNELDEIIRLCSGRGS